MTHRIAGFAAVLLCASVALADPIEAVEPYARKLHDAGQFSGVLLVAHDGTTRLARAYGFAREETKTPNTPETVFNIGSIGKDFTKVAIKQLAAAGKLSLDDTVAMHLPGAPIPSADQITLRQLLEHRSGLGDIFGPRYDAAPPSRLRELSDFLPLFAGEPLGFAPGTSERYSNAGYIVLGLIVERASGEKYRDYVSKNIFTPAGMTRSGFFSVDEAAADRATGYTTRGEGGARLPNTKTLPGRPSSAGGVFSTAGDLLRFYEALASGKLLREAGGAADVAIAGGAPGVNAAVQREKGWTVIAIANLDPPAATTLARGAMDLIRGGPREGRPEGVVIRQRAPRTPERTELAGDVVVPAAMAGHLFTVEARIQGQGPFRFAVDSGSAGMLRMSTELQKKLQLPQIGEARSSDPSGKNPQRRPVVRVDSVAIGGARFDGIDATVGDGRDDGTDGVIGLPLFAGLTATLDYPKQELRLGRRPLDAGAEHVVAFTADRGVPEIEVDAGGVPLKVDVDTGSPALLTVPAPWSSKLSFVGPLKVVGKGRTVANEFEIRGADLRGELRVAGYARPAPRVDVVDLFPVANLGSRFLRDYAVTFDLANRRLALSR